MEKVLCLVRENEIFRQARIRKLFSKLSLRVRFFLHSYFNGFRTAKNIPGSYTEMACFSSASVW